jgi:hypothetical protein
VIGRPQGPSCQRNTGWAAPAGIAQTPFGPKSQPAKLTGVLIWAVVSPFDAGRLPALDGCPVVCTSQLTSLPRPPQPEQTPPTSRDTDLTGPDTKDCVIVPLFDPTSPPARPCELIPETGPIEYDWLIVPWLVTQKPPRA